MSTNVDIGLRLKEERKRLGYTQKGLAERSGIDRLSQINYEHGRRSAPADYLAGLQQLGMDSRYILTGKRKKID